MRYGFEGQQVKLHGPHVESCLSHGFSGPCDGVTPQVYGSCVAAVSHAICFDQLYDTGFVAVCTTCTVCNCLDRTLIDNGSQNEYLEQGFWNLGPGPACTGANSICKSSGIQTVACR